MQPLQFTTYTKRITPCPQSMKRTRQRPARTQCHEDVNSRFIQIDVHSAITREEKPVLYFINLGLTFAFYGSVLGLLGLLSLETFGRKKDGIKWQLRHGTTWRGLSKRWSGRNEE
jgi:hypothetical protein